jgi:hypothetical protein
MTDKATIVAVSTVPVKPDKLDELVQLMQDLLEPTTLPGLQRVHFLVNREDHELKTIAYYETRAAATAIEEGRVQVANQETIERMAKLVSGQVERTIYEVAATLEQAEATLADGTR